MSMVCLLLLYLLSFVRKKFNKSRPAGTRLTKLTVFRQVVTWENNTGFEVQSGVQFFVDSLMITPTKGHRHATQLNLLQTPRKDASGMTEIIQLGRLFFSVVPKLSSDAVACGIMTVWCLDATLFALVFDDSCC